MNWGAYGHNCLNITIKKISLIRKSLRKKFWEQYLNKSALLLKKKENDYNDKLFFDLVQMQGQGLI